jgi:PAS domain S-box-containing protein
MYLCVMNRTKNDQERTPEDGSYQEQLQHYKQRISNILESFTDAFFEVDDRWTVTYWNKEAERLLMMPRDEVIGKNLWQIYADAIPLKFYAEYYRAVEHNISVRFEEYFPPKDIWVEVAAFPSGEGLSVYFKDITEKKKASELLEREREKYHDLFNFSPLPQWVYDVETLAFLQVNEAAISHYGYSRAEFLTMTIADIRLQEDVAILREILSNQVCSGQYNQSTVKHQKKDGQVVTVMVQGNSVSFEGRDARLVLAVDMTERLRDIEAIEAQNKRLLEISWTQAHKVRAPLARVLGLTTLIDGENCGNVEQIKELSGMIRSSAEELDEVVKEILTKSRLHSDR